MIRDFESTVYGTLEILESTLVIGISEMLLTSFALGAS